MDQTPAPEPPAVPDGVLVDEAETVAAVLGTKHLRAWQASGDIREGILVLTDKRLYQLGHYLEPGTDASYDKRKGPVNIEAAALRAVTRTDKPVAKKIGVIGGILLGLGLVILLGGMIDGSVFGLVVAIFIGAAWLAVPGAIMLSHWKTGARKFLDIQHDGGTFAMARGWYAEDEITAFEEAFQASLS